MQRRKLLAGLAGLVLSGLLLWLFQPSRITQENAARIRQGMTRTEVHAILGWPNYFPSEERRSNELAKPWSPLGECWHGAKASVTVWFDQSGHVKRTEMIANDPNAYDPWGEIGLLEKIRALW
jgi:hypothetical protein